MVFYEHGDHIYSASPLAQAGATKHYLYFSICLNKRLRFVLSQGSWFVPGTNLGFRSWFVRRRMNHGP